MRTIAIAALALVVSCGRGKHETGTHEAAPPPPSAAIDAAAATEDAAAPIDAPAASASALPAECDAPLRALAMQIARMHRAMEPQAPRAKAIELWKAVDAPCRRSGWYLAAAQIERWGPEKLVAGGVTIATTEEALVAGLAANDDRRILVLTAFAAALGGRPMLPRDACERATAIPGDADDLAYVCGHAALAAGDYKGAYEQLTAIKDAVRFPDLALRRAQAVSQLGVRTQASALFKAAAKLDGVAAFAFGATEREYARLIADAKAAK